MASQAPIERFPALEALSFAHAFLGRVPGVDVAVERSAALARLDGCHRAARAGLGWGDLPFVTAEQIHGREIAVLAKGDPLPQGPTPGVDGLITDQAGVCLGIYVADCCPVYLADRANGAIGLVHAGRKGAELGIVPAAIDAMKRAFGTDPARLTVQLGPCIRPPWYEVDFAGEIVRQARESGVGRVVDCGICTASHPDAYYSYRREKGCTGRMLALLVAPGGI
jgi:copper oxidase (laccase) domain-containing protein